MRAPAGPGWALVGDAAVHQDPWTGAGMDTAGRHAVLAADAIADWLGGRVTEAEAFGRYRRDRDEHVLADWPECTTLARDLSQLAAASQTRARRRGSRRSRRRVSGSSVHSATRPT